MASVNANELENAMPLVSGQNYLAEAWVCRETGKVFVRSDEVDPIMETIPDDIEDDDKYLPIPDARSLDLGHTLVFRFTEAEMAQDYDEVRQMFRRSGAYGRFDKLVDDRGLRDRWHRFRWAREPALRIPLSASSYETWLVGVSRRMGTPCPRGLCAPRT